MTLAEFLLARIAEDGRTPAWDETGALARHPRVLAECEAKRRMVVEAQRVAVQTHRTMGPLSDLADFVLTHLALPYADHPDYRQEWKP